MVKVTVKDRWALVNLGTESSLAASEYLYETANAQQTLKLKTEDQSSEALSAFVERLNELSNQIFSVFPQLLGDFGSAITTYTSELEDEGFYDGEVYTKKNDIDSITTWLTKSRYDTIEEKGTTLDGAMKDLIDVIESSPKAKEIGKVSTEDIIKDASTELSRLAKARMSTHGTLTASLGKFKESLDTIYVGLTGVQASLNNAMFINTVSADKMVKWLLEGTLNVENMSYINAVRTYGDSEILEVILSEGKGEYADLNKFYSQLGSFNAQNMSQSMSDIIHSRLLAQYTLTREQGDEAGLKHLTAFFKSLDNQDMAQAEEYLKKLIFSGDRYAEMIGTAARMINPEVGWTEDEMRSYQSRLNAVQPKQQELSRKLDHVGKLAALLESLYGQELGEKVGVTKLNPETGGHTYDASHRLKKLSITDDGDFRYSLAIGMMGGVKTHKLTTTFHETSNDVQLKKNSQRLVELEAEREQAKVEFVVNLAADGVSLFIPGSDEVVDAIKLVVNNEGISQISLAVADTMGEHILGETDYNTIMKAKTSTAKDILDYFGKVAKINAEIMELSGNSIAIRFDGGGYSIEAGEKIISSEFRMQYDLQAQLQADDLVKNGMRSYVYRSMDYNLDRLNEFDKGMMGQGRATSDLSKATIYSELSDSEKVAYRVLQGKHNSLDGTSIKDIDRVVEILSDNTRQLGGTFNYSRFDKFFKEISNFYDTYLD